MGGGAATVEFQAACAWLAESLAADADGDSTRLDAAHAVIREIPTWRGFSDPTLADESLQSLIQDVVGAALESRRQPVQRFLVANCD